MDIALIVNGNCGIDSFKWENENPIKLSDGSTYERASGIRNVFLCTAPFDGYVINWSQGLPVRDFSHILYCEPSPYPGHNIDELRRTYPNAEIIAYVKEKNPSWYLPQFRVDMFQAADRVFLPYRESACETVAKAIDREVISFPYPYPIWKMGMFWKESKGNYVFNGANINRGYAESELFGLKLAEELCLNYVGHQDGLTWHEWLWNVYNAKYVVNLDPMPEIGQCPIECAALNTIHVGGHADAAKALWGDLATNNEDYLMNRVLDIAALGEEPGVVIKAYNNAIQRHDYESARERFFSNAS